MTQPSRLLTAADIANLLGIQAEAIAPAEVFTAAARLVEATCGSLILLTVLLYHEATAEVERLYSSDPAYPVGGRKKLSDFPSNHAGMAKGEAFLAATKAEVAASYADHERLFQMGITSILNAPIRHAGRRLATLNLCGRELQFGAGHVAAARTIAAALAPTLLAYSSPLPDPPRLE